MGRPPLHVKETKVRLTAEHRSRIEALVGPNRMATFIREAVEEKLDRDEADRDGANRGKETTKDPAAG